MNNHGMSNALIYAVSKIRVIFDNGNPAECMENNGTGFFILREDKEYFITNRHVLDPEKTEGIAGKGYKMQTIYIDLRNYDEATKTPLSEELFVKSCNYKFADNNFDDIENQLKLEYNKEEIKKTKAYEQLIELKKEENLINLNIQYFENLLMKMKYND